MPVVHCHSTAAKRQAIITKHYAVIALGKEELREREEKLHAYFEEMRRQRDLDGLPYL
jgi:hypothetical protein